MRTLPRLIFPHTTWKNNSRKESLHSGPTTIQLSKNHEQLSTKEDKGCGPRHYNYFNNNTILFNKEKARGPRRTPTLNYLDSFTVNEGIINKKLQHSVEGISSGKINQESLLGTSTKEARSLQRSGPQPRSDKALEIISLVARTSTLRVR